MSKWFIDAMTPEDFDRVLEIERASFSHPWSKISYQTELTSRYSCSLTVRNCDSFDSRSVIAYICFRLFDGEMHILKIAVDPDWRRKGIASWLIDNCMDVASSQGARNVFLEVRPSNETAISLYNKLGFRIAAKRPNYYAETREDAYLMINNLKGGFI